MKLTSIAADMAPKWFPYVEDVELLIASSGNPDFKKALRVAFKPHRGRLAQNQLTDKEKEQIALEAAATHLLVGWRGIEDDDDEPIPYSSAKSLEILSDPAYYHVYEFVLTTAGDWQQYLREMEEEALGN